MLFVEGGREGMKEREGEKLNSGHLCLARFDDPVTNSAALSELLTHRWGHVMMCVNLLSCSIK